MSDDLAAHLVTCRAQRTQWDAERRRLLRDLDKQVEEHRTVLERYEALATATRQSLAYLMPDNLAQTPAPVTRLLALLRADPTSQSKAAPVTLTPEQTARLLGQEDDPWIR